MLTNEEMRGNIMRRVWGVYYLRALMSPLARVGVIGAALIAVSAYVSVSHVLLNASQKQGLFEFGKFAVEAFVNTRSVVQVAILIAGAVLVWSVVDFVQSIQQRPSWA